MYYIGIDLGTSSVKLLLSDEQGVQNIVTREYEVSYPRSGWSEQNPEDWWRETKEGIKELTKDTDRSLVKGLGIGGQMHGLVILDSDDNVIRPAILWNDTRTQKQTDYLNNCVGRKQLVDMTGNIAFAGFTAPKIMWVRDNEPDNFRRIDKIMLPKDYIVYRLTGKFCTDVSDASGMLLLDVKNRTWSEDMLNITGVKRSQLPEIHESYEVVGTIKKEIAESLGFGEVSVVAGAGDNAAAAIGTGAVHNGDCNISLGTSGTVFVSCDNYKADYENAIHNFCHATGAYHYMACILSAASCNKWWLEDILGTDDYTAAYSDYDIRRDNGIIFLPYMMGERSPHNDADIRGMFYGLSMSTTRKDMSYAILEGVAFALRQNIDIIKSMGIDIRKSTICGGGTKNKIWLKITASVLNIELEVPENQEGASFGAALLAMRGNDESAYSNMLRNLRISETIKPDSVLAERYNKKYELFRKLYPAVRNVIRA